MNNEEARRIFQAIRPNGADAADPQVRAAMERLKHDSTLAGEFTVQKEFDAGMAASLQSVPVPCDLRSALLAVRPRVVRVPVSWWRPIWNDWRFRAAAAAAIALFCSLAGLISLQGPTGFADFRKEMIEEGWSGANHLAFHSPNLIRVKQWLAGNGGPTEFRLPPEFQGHRLQGCDVFEVSGHRVAVLCLANGSKHLHLFVAEGVQFADLPRDGAPDFERCGLWKTVAWQNGPRTFVLAGMKNQSFVNTFRKAGRWTMSG